MIINLTKVEHALARRVGLLRYEQNRKWGTESGLRIKEKYQQYEIDGFGAELALAKALNVYPDLCVDEASTEDIFYKGASIDVKQTANEYGLLLLTMEKTKFCDWYCLVVGRLPTFRIAGFARLDELRKDKNIIDLGYGDTYALKQNNLIAIEDFVNTQEL